MILITTVTGQNLAGPLVCILTRCLCSPYQHRITPPSGSILAGCVTAISDGAFHLRDADIMQLLQGVWVQSGGWAHIL